MTFTIQALPAEPYSDFKTMSEADLAQRGIQRIIAETKASYPCRVSLEDAEIGETVYLLNHTHHDVSTPYRAAHAIFVREDAVQAQLEIDEIPNAIAIRLISLRGFNRAGNMIDADVVNGTALSQKIPAMLSNQEIAYVHLHHAKPGCFAARVERR